MGIASSSRRRARPEVDGSRSRPRRAEVEGGNVAQQSDEGLGPVDGAGTAGFRRRLDGIAPSHQPREGPAPSSRSRSGAPTRATKCTRAPWPRSPGRTRRSPPAARGRAGTPASARSRSRRRGCRGDARPPRTGHRGSRSAATMPTPPAGRVRRASRGPGCRARRNCRRANSPAPACGIRSPRPGRRGRSRHRARGVRTGSACRENRYARPSSRSSGSAAREPAGPRAVAAGPHRDSPA